MCFTLARAKTEIWLTDTLRQHVLEAMSSIDEGGLFVIIEETPVIITGLKSLKVLELKSGKIYFLSYGSENARFLFEALDVV